MESSKGGSTPCWSAEFAQRWGFQHTISSLTYPHIKKLTDASWPGSHLDEEKLTKALQIYLKRMVYLQHKSYFKGTSRIRSWCTIVYFQLKGSIVQRKPINKLVPTEYNQHAQALPEIHVGSKVAIQNLQTKLWDI